LFLSVYGIDTGYTILERLRKKENIFKPHRQHLYQRLANEGKQSHLVISTIYASVQLAVNAVVVFTTWNIIITGLIIMIPLSITYFWLKRKYL
jgi:hypothetical protein